MNSVVLPGVELGDFTIVAAGAVITKSFKDGYCVIGGNPTKVIKTIPQIECAKFENEYKYNRYIHSKKFNKFRIS